MHMPYVIESDGSSLRQYDIPSKLFNENVILVEGSITEEMAYSVKAQLILLDSRDSCTNIDMHISSGGGCVYSGQAIIDMMNHISKPVNTICTGIAMSMGLQILASGTGIRSSMPNSRIMCHSVSSGTQGTIHDMEIAMEESKFLQEKMLKDLVKNSNKKITLKEIKLLTQRDCFLSPTEAMSKGFIDKINKSKKNTI